MTPQQLALIPDDLLTPTKAGAAELLTWLYARGLKLNLLDLELERLRRGIRKPKGALRSIARTERTAA